jgi:hypothetical protein
MTQREAPPVLTSAQALHRVAAEHHERAFKHHRQAALMLDAGNTLEASSHAAIARFCAARALNAGEKAIELATVSADEKKPDTVAGLITLSSRAQGGEAQGLGARENYISSC